jgi:hypothetical protein
MVAGRVPKGGRSESIDCLSTPGDILAKLLACISDG